MHPRLLLRTAVSALPESHPWRSHCRPAGSSGSPESCEALECNTHRRPWQPPRPFRRHPWPAYPDRRRLVCGNRNRSVSFPVFRCVHTAADGRCRFPDGRTRCRASPQRSGCTGDRPHSRNRTVMYCDRYKPQTVLCEPDPRPWIQTPDTPWFRWHPGSASDRFEDQSLPRASFPRKADAAQ